MRAGRFITASLISIGLGLLMVNLFQPGLWRADPLMRLRQKPPWRGCPSERAGIHPFGSSRPARSRRWPPTISCRSGLLDLRQVALAVGEKGAPLVRGADALAEMMLR